MNTWAAGNSRSREPVPDVIGDDYALLQILRAARKASVELRNSIIYERGYPLEGIRSLVEHVEQALVFARTSDTYSDVCRVDDLTRHLLKRLVEPGQFPAKGENDAIAFPNEDVRAVAGHIADDLSEVCERLLRRDLVSHPVHAGPAQQRPVVSVVPSARWLLAAGARLLPAVNRARFAEEFRGELWEVARAGAGPWEQVRYALRQAGRIVSLRGAVRAPRRKRAAP